MSWLKLSTFRQGKKLWQIKDKENHSLHSTQPFLTWHHGVGPRHQKVIYSTIVSFLSSISVGVKWIILILTDWYCIQLVVLLNSVIIDSTWLLTVTWSSNHCHALQSCCLTVIAAWMIVALSPWKRPVLSPTNCIMGRKWLLWIVSD